MLQLSAEQLNTLDKDALVIIAASLQEQLNAMSLQLDNANRQLADTSRQIELLTEQIRIMNQRQFGRKSESGLSDMDGLPAEVYKRLHIIPETFIVDEHHVHVYASKDNDGTIIKAERPADLFRNSIATASLVASMINGKYVNVLPLERQSRAYKTNGINLSTNTMANWVIKSCDYYLSLIYDRLHEQIYNSKVIHADESPVKTMWIDNAKIKNGKKTFMWVYRNRQTRGTHPIVLFDRQSSRRSDHPRDFLKNFSGTVITDGYQVYHKIAGERQDLKVAGCWIHARRPSGRRASKTASG